MLSSSALSFLQMPTSAVLEAMKYSQAVFKIIQSMQLWCSCLNISSVCLKKKTLHVLCIKMNMSVAEKQAYFSDLKQI